MDYTCLKNTENVCLSVRLFFDTCQQIEFLIPIKRVNSKFTLSSGYHTIQMVSITRIPGELWKEQESLGGKQERLKSRGQGAKGITQVGGGG